MRYAINFDTVFLSIAAYLAIYFLKIREKTCYTCNFDSFFKNVEARF